MANLMHYYRLFYKKTKETLGRTKRREEYVVLDYNNSGVKKKISARNLCIRGQLCSNRKKTKHSLREARKRQSSCFDKYNESSLGIKYLDRIKKTI